MQECNQYNENGLRHGYWEQYYYNGRLWFKGNYVNGLQHDYWETYHDNGKLAYMGYFHMGKFIKYFKIVNDEYYYARMESI